MKTYLSIALIFVSIILFGQTRNDTVDFNNINNSFLNELVFEKSNDERKKVSAAPFIKHEVCFLSAKYQSEYMSSYKILCHKNELTFQNVKLVEFYDRISFFSKKLNQEMRPSDEICLLRPYFYKKKITYDSLSYEIINQFMNSKPHRISLLLDSKLGDTSFAGFSTSTVKEGKYIKFYVTGVSGYLFTKKNNLIIHH